jgi:hypothetical protein
MSGSVRGLNVSDVVQVSVNLTPLPVPLRNFGSLMIVGPTEGVINVGERFRAYSSLTAVQADFGSTGPEVTAATVFFSQSPQPAFLYVGRWAQAATYGWLYGATLATATQIITTWTVITNGSFDISIDGTPYAMTGLNFSSATNMNSVASIIQASLPAGSQCTWDANYSRFKIRGIATGSGGAVSFATPAGSGTDISTLAGLSAASGASAPVPGIPAETPLACMTALVAASNAWYGVMFAPVLPTDITDSQYEAVANLIEAQSPSRIFGITTQEAAVPDPTQTTDLASVLMGFDLQHTFIQYSSMSLYACASIFGRAFTVNFTASNSTITLKFQQEPTITPETLNENQAQALNSKNCNVYVSYSNGANIVQQGVMCGGAFIDERHGLDWLQNNVQTNVFNELYTVGTKIPMTDPGIHVLATIVSDAMLDGVNNGLIAPGVWQTAAVFGTLVEGQFLSTGFYVFAPSVATISESQRAARIAPTIQCAVKLAGAVHYSSVILNVNR